MLRIRLKTEVPSLRSAGVSVANVSEATGRNTKLTPTPCAKPDQTMRRYSHLQIEAGHLPRSRAVSANPVPTISRGSNFLISRGITNSAITEPIPRGAVTSPVVNTG